MSAPEAVAEELVEQAPTVVGKADEVAADNETAQEMVADKVAETAQQAASTPDNSPATPQNDVQQQQTAGPKEEKGLTQKVAEGAKALKDYALKGSKAEQKRQKVVQGLLNDANLPDEKFKELPKKRQEAAKKQKAKVDKAQQKLDSALDAPASGDWASVSDNMMKVLDAKVQLNKESGGVDNIAGRLNAVGGSTVSGLLKGGKAALTAPIKAVKKITEMAKSQGMTPEEALMKKCKEDGLSPEQTKEKLDQWKQIQQQAQGVTQLVDTGVAQKVSPTKGAGETGPTAVLEQANTQANTEEEDLGVTSLGPGSTSSNN